MDPRKWDLRNVFIRYAHACLSQNRLLNKIINNSVRCRLQYAYTKLLCQSNFVQVLSLSLLFQVCIFVVTLFFSWPSPISAMFYVSPACITLHQIVYCFACDAGGSVEDYVASLVYSVCHLPSTHTTVRATWNEGRVEMANTVIMGTHSEISYWLIIHKQRYKKIGWKSKGLTGK